MGHQRRVLLALAQTPQRHDLFEHTELLGRLLFQVALEGWRLDATRTDRIDLHIGAGDLVGHRTGEGDNRTFGCRVMRAVRAHGGNAGNAGDVDDLAVALGLHALQGGAGAIEHAVDVYRPKALPFGIVHVASDLQRLTGQRLGHQRVMALASLVILGFIRHQRGIVDEDV
ncbi:hypothetical protein D3C79_887310 [compost metagenome]